MEKIFLIQSALVSKDNLEQPRWQNCYCVRSEEEARKDCIIGQNRSDISHSGYSFKMIYRYQIIELF